ncbi:metal ABC transporter ATP-binding protein [Aurantimonas sp. MSK8Z-1]|uniref:ATP-binding cassette domain-containing protein n=1 Tax=Mangrovibrevibacter kandeliae TaxID=2968473 RepID=UPI0021177B70|nr:metal ABC transporter ATP-binding protein [Aurantimonas sp. MSK8Z-1]MCW4116783.1 metal ABC transporter ATP-binding protein [Aurantimonas sp. MSK8Z-1]
MEQLITLQGVGVRRGGRWLVRDVDLSVAPGEIVTLVGPNGAGKTTTAKAAIGVLRVDAGRVLRRPDLTVGYVPQKLAIDWTLPLTVRRLMTLSGRQPASAIATALAEVGLSGHLEAQVQHLSGGEFQRALLARALVRRPDLLVLDEPAQGVDVAGEAEFYALIRAARDRTGCGVLLISHDLNMVMAATDTVICLNGHVCCRGTPEAVAGSADYLRLFGPRAAEGLALYRHRHDHEHLPDGRVRHGDGSITGHCHAGDGHHHEHDAAQGGPEAPPANPEARAGARSEDARQAEATDA